MKHIRKQVIQSIVLFLVLVAAALVGWNVVYATGGGNALDFDGVMDATGDYVTAGFDPSATLGQSFTIEAWVNPRSAGDYRGIAGDHWGADGLIFGQYENAAGGWIFGGYDGSSGLPGAVVPTIPLNQWSHVAAVYIGNAAGPGRITVYLNGEWAAQSSWTNRTISPYTNFYIGRAHRNNDRFFDGRIDDFRVWNTARTGADIQADMYADLTGSESNLVAYYTFNQGVAGADNTGVTTLTDLTANAYDGTLHNFALSGAASNWVSDGGYGIVENITGNGTGGIVRSPDRQLFAAGDTVTLSADPDPASSFAGWSGACTGMGDCVLTMDSHQTVTAAFTWGGGPTWDTMRPADLILGFRGNALDFDGVMDATGDYVTAGFDPSATLGQSFTIEAWVNPRSAGDYRGIAGDHWGADGLIFGQYENAAGGWVFGGYDGSSGLPGAVVPTIPLNQWSHVAAVYIGNAAGPGSFTVYLNGEQVAQSTWTNRTISPYTNFYIGRAHSNNDRFFDGQIDDFRVWNTARTGPQIQADMVADLTGGESNLVAAYTFDQGDAGGDNAGRTTLEDLSGNRHHGTLHNFALSGATSNWVAAGNRVGALNQPYGVTVDPTTGKVFVADTYNHRVLRYASSTALLNDALPEGVLGQADFVSNLVNRGGGAPAANTLYTPIGMVVDSAGRLWVSDYSNHRVLWFDDAAGKANGAAADGVLGQADFTTGTANNGGLSANTLRAPYGVGVDEAGNLWVVDANNHRVLHWNDAATLTNGEAADGVLGQPDFTSNAANGGGSTAANSLNNPTGLVVSADGTLFVGDTSNHRVLRFANAAVKANGADADGVLGQPDFTANAAAVTRSGMASPYGVALDPDGRLFVVDYHAHRVTIYEDAAAKANGANADGVLGQPDFTTGTPNTGTPGTGARSAATLNFPVLAFYDPALPALWVGDIGNNRVLAYGFGVTVEEAGNGMGTITRTPDQRLYAPGTEVTLALDPGYDNELIWSGGGCSGSGACTLTLDDYKVVTATILRRSADLVLGQPNFSEGRAGTSPTTLSGPHAVAVDPATGKVFVADYHNHRVLRYASSTALRNGDPAEGVLGQADFVSNSPNRGGATAANTFNHPLGLAVDSAGRLWVADQDNHRVLWFDDAASKADGANADGVLGQSNFDTTTPATSQTGMNGPYDVFVDAAGNLWVVDTYNHRVLRFDDAHTRANGANADGVLGQPDFTSNAPAATQNGMNIPLGVVVAADGTLFVADGYNYRVLRFNNAAAKTNGANADGVLGQPDFTSNAIALTQSGMNEPYGLALDPDGRLFVADRHHNRVLIYDGAANKANGADADGVLGQPDFTTGAPNTGTPGTGARSAATLNEPIWIWYDPALEVLWVADSANNRVLAYSDLSVYTAGNGTGQVSRIPDQQLFDPGSLVTLVPEPDPGSTFAGWGGACTGTGDCTVTLDEVRTVQATFTWKGGPTWNAMRPADLVLGQPNFTTGDAGASQSTLMDPHAIAVDPTTGKVFVADTNNHRVLRYASSTALRNGAPAEGVLGQADFVSGSANRGGAPAANTLNSPVGMVVDSAGRLWVADFDTNRVLWFNDAAGKANGAAADGVLGQPGFTTGTANNGGLSASTLNYPYGLWVDEGGHLWVVDTYNHRVLRWDDAATLTNGEAADGVLGQPDFTSNAANRGGSTAANSLNIPTGLVVSADGTLFVSDLYNRRTLRFNNAAAKANGAAADGVLGQPDFTSNAAAVTRRGMHNPYGVALDPDGRLFVVNYGAHRVTIYENAANKANGADADGVLGQPDFTTGTPNTGTPPGTRSAAGLSGPVMAFYDPTLPALWVGDSLNNRVLAYGFGITVNTAGSGTGDVSRVPDGQIFGQDSEVTLSADPAYDTYFTGWSQDCSGAGDCTLTMDDYKEVTAAFQGPLYVCSPTLDAAAMPKRCHYTSIAAALDAAVAGDVIVVSGVVTESVTVNKSVTIQGMLPGDILPDATRPAPGAYPVYTPGADPEEIEPGTHMALVQAAPGPNSGAGSVFSIAAGVQVTITQLNIRYGDAVQGGGIHNAGTLLLDSVTLYANYGDQGGALYNAGTLTVINSTLSGNDADDGVNLYNSAAGTAVVGYSTLAVSPMQIATNLYNANATAGSFTVGGAILSAPAAGSQCTGDITSADYNLRYGGTCFGTPGANDAVGDPLLGALRDNGGPTLTHNPDALSPAVDGGAATCAVTRDQRGRARPFDAACDIGAVETGARRLTVCQGCAPDAEALLFTDPHAALYQALAGDTIAFEMGAYTGNFIAYKDVTLQHAGIDVAALDPEDPVDVRAILQGSASDLDAQYAGLNSLQSNVGDPVLTVQAYTYPADSPDNPVAASGDVSVTLQDLTVRYGLSRRGGGITNLGQLHLLRTTVAENAAVNALRANGSVADAAQGGGIYNAGTLTLERSTVSGNRAESYGGGLYNRGAGASEKAHLTLLASTLAANQAAPIPDDHTLVIAGFFGGGDVTFTNPIAEAVSGDRIHFHNQIGNDITLSITPAGVCNRDSIDLTAMSMSEVDLICYAGTTSVDVTISGGSDFPDLATTITIRPPSFLRAAHALYGSSYSEITVTHSILVHQITGGPSDGGTTCRVSSSLVHSGGYNLSDDTSCRLWDVTDQQADARLGPLQDNNQIDFVAGTLSGYAHTHALRPDSPAIDQIPPETCDVGNHTLNITSTVMTASLSLTGTQSIQQGDVVQWANARSGAVTLALNDGQAGAVLISAAAGASSRQMQFTTPGDYAYTVYDDASRERLGQGTITVLTYTQATDQRGVYVPLRGTTSDYACDIGAYEFQPWVVGEPLLRPPSAVGDQAPLWYLGTGEDRESLDKGSNQYPHHAWNMALLQDIALRPSPNDGNATLVDGEIVGVDWKTNPDPIDLTAMTQIGIVEWPAAPQLHVAGVPVNLDHDALSDDYNISGATPFKNRDIDTEADVLAMGIFTRDTYASGAAAYTVINWGKGTQSGAALQVQVIQTLDWNTPGVRDMRQARTTCDIGTRLAYGLSSDADRHEDLEEKNGYVLTGDAYDGARTTIDMLRVQNTVGDLIPPAHNRETREGPIIPVLNLAPTTFANPDPVTGGHDLRVAWYRPDGRNVAWPVKAVGYRCEWPANPPEIVIASELGSEIGGQPVLNTDYYQNPAVYHQPDPDEPGYSLNDEHALLAASNLGNTGPALYALRTDLTSQPYALLKYLDPREEDEPKIAVYAVVLTRTATAVTNVLTDDGAITLLSSSQRSPLLAGEGPGERSSSPALTLRVGAADLLPDGTATVAVEALNARALRSVNVTVQYDPTKITPTACTPNRQDLVEDLSGLSLSTNAPRGIQPMRTVRLRANLAAGTDARYTWDFGDGVTRIAGAEVSHVYGAVGVYTVRVTADNGHFASVSTSTTINVTENEDAIAEDLPEVTDTGCCIETPGELTLVLQTRNKHGLSGNLLLADLSFEAVGDPPAVDTDTPLGIVVDALHGPAYESLEFGITAGNPIYAPAPMQGLLDLQPCEQSVPDDVANARPFWRDFKGMLWARAAGSMEMLYFYPLQMGFYLDDTHAADLGLGDLTADERVGSCIPWMDQLAQGTASYADFPEEGDTTRVLPVAYDVTWPPLPALLSVGETVYERAKGGVSGVANQLAVSRIYDDYAPGQWDNDAGKIVVAGQEVTRTLAQLIDPVGEVRVSLPIRINDNYALPQVIQTQRLLFGGGLAIAGNKDDRDLALPFSLRSRILYDDTNGELIFRGYYDGSSAAYLKGDPLLLLNVMSLADKNRLLAICPEGKENCDTYRTAIEALYHKTRNPRELDLDGDGTPDQDLLIGVQDADGNGEPEPYEGVGKGKALSAGNAAGVGYITLAYNNDPSAGDLPVSLQVIQVGCTQNHLGEDSTYRGNVLVVQSDNVFDEKLTLRHTGDFGGRPDDFEFEWWLAPVDDTGVSPSQLPASYPWQSWTRLEPGMSELGPEITLEGANPTTLSDNWLIVRYKGYPICGNAYRWSAFAGDPSAKPSEVRAQLAEGWIKRVTNALNPFDTRVADFVSAPVNTNVDMVRQAGPRYEGPIAFNGDPDNLNQIGLIEAYQTVLDRGRSLSIDSSINHQGANAALLNVSTRIAALYMLLGNDAYMDALDPTVGLSTDSAFGARSAAMFSFMNQFNASFGLLDEELTLLRGRDETLGGVAASPTYNRLTWNFTNGDGEVAYVTNYNIKDYNEDGFLNEADAALMYPQGHGDAWGHYLTAIKTYYELLRHPSYTWIPRAEPIAVGGAPLVADYYDERRFASAAVNKARAGADVVDLTYRKQFADPDTELYTDPHVDDSDGQQRAWGVADWAKRSGQGAYFDWVVGNAILPPIEERYTDVRKIDRTTVSDLGEIVNQYANIQDQLDKADNNLNPLGLAQGAVLFDLNPALANSTPGGDQTHFEQVYDRALGSLDNAQVLFDYANEMKLAERQSEAQQRDFVTMITEQDTAIINELIELFGYPYDADIGVNGTYPEDYAGPDIYNYDLVDRTELTDFQKRCAETNSPEDCAAETTTHIVEYKPMDCLGFYVDAIESGTVASEFVCPNGDQGIVTYEAETLDIEYRVGTGLDAGYGRFKPVSWPEDSRRAAPGEIQNALQALYQARMEYEYAVAQYEGHAGSVEGVAKKIRDRYEVLEHQGDLNSEYGASMTAIDNAIFSVQTTMKVLNYISSFFKFFADTVKECPPQNVGLAVSVGDPAKCTIKLAGSIPAFVLDQIASGLDFSIAPMQYAKGVVAGELSSALFATSTDYELRQLGREMGSIIGQEYDLRVNVYLAADRYNRAKSNYDQVLYRGYRKLAELTRLRKRWAGQISEQRYNDMAYRIFQFEALQKYRQQFDLAQQYTYLTAAAYDYETNLAMTDAANGSMFVRQIAVERSLGELQGGQPIVGSGGLAGSMAQMRDNFSVLKGQLGFNNPQYEANRFSLRRELLRLRDGSDAKWQDALNEYYVSNVYANDDVALLAKLPYGSEPNEPGLVIPFDTSVIEGQNFFGQPLGPGDSSYDATQFSTKIAAVGVWFAGYDTTRLAETPRVYLLPAGDDVLRPRNTDNRLRYWNVAEQLLPLPYTLGEAEMADPSWIASMDGLDGQIFERKPYARFRAYPYTPDFSPDEMTIDTRLIGRSVWNTRWVLVIPGSTLLSDSQQGIQRFIEDVDDVYIYFQTYAYAGTRR